MAAPLATPPTTARKVLLVDDDPFMLKVMEAMLQAMGDLEVHGFSNAPAAFEAIRDAKLRPDLVILDINMPEMDGMAFFRRLSEVGYAGCLALCSGEGDSFLRTTAQLAQSYGLRVSGVLGKPPRPERLKALLGDCAAQAVQAPRASSPERSVEELLQALERGEIFCVYQPKVSLADGSLLGLEALARWRHPTDGIIFPAAFIPMAERSGNIGVLTRRVFELAFAQVAAWRGRGLDWLVSVNASAHDLGVLDFPDFLLDCARRHGVDPSWVMIEVTESGLTRDERLLVEVMTRLRLRQFRMSIDDFGNGYAALSKLRDLVFDELKIDFGFTHGAAADERKAAIFDASVQVGKSLGMKLVAEGVEDVADWDFSRIHGAEVAQGYFVARPLAAEDVETWLDAWRQRYRTLIAAPAAPSA